VALTNDHAMSALTVAIWGISDQICSMRDFLRMTDAVEKVLVIIDES
jgi:hypothetical protein